MPFDVISVQENDTRSHHLAGTPEHNRPPHYPAGRRAGADPGGVLRDIMSS